jgi:hypothetical protein
MKDRQKLEAHTIIEFEIKQQILRKEQEDHINKHKLDKEKDIRDFIRNKKIQDLKDRKIELKINLREIMDIIKIENNKEKENQENQEIQEKQENEEKEEKEKALYYGMALEDAKEFIEYNIIQIEEEINKINLEEIDEKKRKNETKLKENENFKKNKEYHDKAIKDYMNEYKKSYELRKLNEKKEKERLEILEKKRLQKIKENEIINYLHKKRYEESNNKIQEKLKKEFQVISRKLISSKENRLNYQETKKIAMKKKVELHMQKQMEIKNFLEKHIENDQLKDIQLKIKMKEKENQKKINDYNREREIKEKLNELNYKSLKTQESRNKIQDEIFKENDSTMNRMKNIINKSNKNRENIEKEKMFNYEKNFQKRNDVELNIKRNENKKEIERKKALENIFEKHKKFEDLISQKIINSDKKRILSIEFSNERKNTLEKLDDFINRYKEINVNFFYDFYFYFIFYI